MKRITFDTNIYLHNIDLLTDEKFCDLEIVSVIPVVSELDHIKTTSTRGDLKNRGRIATRTLKKLVDEGKVKPLIVEDLPDIMSLSKYDVMDDLILTICKKENLKLITMDYNVYLKALHLGVEVGFVEKEKKIENLSMVYKGKKQPIYVSKDIMDKIYNDGYVNIREVAKDLEFYPNECVTLIDYSNSKSVRHMKYLDGKLHKIKYVEKSNFYGVTAWSDEQKFALGLLNDDSIRIVTLTGEAGSSKTILSFAVGLEKCVDSATKGKLYIAKPPVSLSRKLQQGFKKGTILEKAIESLGSYSTNLERMAESRGEKKQINGKKILMDMLETEKITYLSLEDVLGMSFGEDDFIIVDEAELLTKDEMKAVLTRGGKFVVIGDCEQNSEMSDVDYDNSGLLHLIEVGKQSKLIAHLTLEECYRSEMVKEINEIW